MGRLQGRRAFVTGGAAGIGAAIVRLFSAEGAHVVAADLTPSDADPRTPAVGPIAFTVDVTDFAAASAAIDANGPFDILVNNAGADQHAFFTETTPADWRRLLAVNLEAVFACTHAVLPGMQAARFGRIINIASEAGRQGSRGGAVYAAAKGGVIAFTKSIARENARYGITANVIAPGPIDTPMLQRAVTFGGPKILETMRSSTLLGRLGTPREIAHAALFFASEGASFITGETLGVSGGMGVGSP
jgi:2-hydroxycyclohexanecarboxyl-CoA dehydrogenase